MLNFEFLKKALGMVSPPYFVHDFSKKKKKYLSYVLLTDTFHCLTAFTLFVIQFVKSDFEIYLSFLIKSFFVHD